MNIDKMRCQMRKMSVALIGILSCYHELEHRLRVSFNDWEEGIRQARGKVGTETSPK